VEEVGLVPDEDAVEELATASGALSADNGS